jgi:regulator of sigma E protease
MAGAFQAKPVWQRFLIVLAGPATNFLLAILIITGFNMALGVGRTPPVVGFVEANSAAEQAGIRPGDQIVSIAGAGIDRFEQIARHVILRPEESLTLQVERDGAIREVAARIKPEIERDRFGNEFRKGVLGVRPHPEAIIIERVSPGRAVVAAVGQSWVVVVTTVEGLGQIITGRRSAKELGGPLKIAKFSGEQASMGWLAFASFLAIISINLGFINLLPIPMLDGGHLLFYLIEGIRRKPLEPEAQEWAFRTGLAALLALMIFVTFNDLASFGLFSKLGGLIG